MRRELASLLPNLAFLALVLGGEWLFRINAPPHQDVWTVMAFAAWLVAVFVTATVVHELGHGLAVRLVGERVLGVRLGGQFAQVIVSLGTVPVSVGLGTGGSVSFSAINISLPVASGVTPK